MKKNYVILSIFGLIFIILFIFLFIIFSNPIICEGDSDKFIEAAKQVGDKINPTISGNNIENKIDKPNINLNNPNINIPSYV
jgi:hypothetical protein